MKLKKLNGKEVNFNINSYRIDWDCESASKFQTRVKDFFRPYWQGQIVLEEFRIPSTLWRIDFLNLNKKLAVEVNGNQHREYNEHFHQGSRVKYLNQIKRDYKKEQWILLNGFLYCEVFPEDMPLTLEFFKLKYNIDI